MGLPNTTPTELEKTERRFRILLYKFFAARGNIDQRQKLTAQMRELRQRLCVSWDKFVDWFVSTFSLFSRSEHERAVKRVTPIYADQLAKMYKYPASPFSPQTIH